MREKTSAGKVLIAPDAARFCSFPQHLSALRWRAIAVEKRLKLDDLTSNITFDIVVI
jgi:hypothetical protein